VRWNQIDRIRNTASTLAAYGPLQLLSDIHIQHVTFRQNETQRVDEAELLRDISDQELRSYYSILCQVSNCPG